MPQQRCQRISSACAQPAEPSGLRPGDTGLAALGAWTQPASELLFDCGPGELFIVRNAGNSLDLAAPGIEYAVRHLGLPLIMILGHEGCGAVQAAVSLMKTGELPDAIAAMVKPILPAALKRYRREADHDRRCRGASSMVQAMPASVRSSLPPSSESKPPVEHAIAADPDLAMTRRPMVARSSSSQTYSDA
ncbi:carbonic anhydrase [Inquilinus limosus]|uniref:carbonic anhydrase n=1 Tax=Inquilinus limosus TaxID=171674 RepID=UPI003F188FC9